MTSDWPWDSPVVGKTLIGQVPLRSLWGWPNLVLEGHLPMGHACWHAQGCRLLVLARMGLLEAWRATIVGSCVVTSASERVGWSLFELWGGLLSAIVLMPSNPWVPEMNPCIQRILSRQQLLLVRLIEGLPVKDA